MAQVRGQAGIPGKRGCVKKESPEKFRQFLRPVWYLDALLFWAVFTGSTIFMIWLLSSGTRAQLQEKTWNYLTTTTRIVATLLDPSLETKDNTPATGQFMRNLKKAVPFLKAVKAENKDLVDILLVRGDPSAPEVVYDLSRSDGATAKSPPDNIFSGAKMTALLTEAQRSPRPTFSDWAFLLEGGDLGVSTASTNLPEFVLMQVPGWSALPPSQRPVAVLVFDTTGLREEFVRIEDYKVRIIGLTILIATLLSLLIRRRTLQREEAVQERLAAVNLLRQRDSILAALAGAADDLLIAEDLNPPLHEILAKICAVLEVEAGSIHILPARQRPGNEARQVCYPESSKDFLFDFSRLHEPAWKRWRAAFAHGKPIAGTVAGFPREERLALEEKGIAWMAVFPIVYGGQNLGYFAFQNNRDDIFLEAGLMDALRLASDLTGAALARHENERQLRQASKMEALGRMAGGVAHEFNNLLHIISGNLHRLLDGADSAGGNEILIQNVASATQRGTRIVAQLLRATSQSQTVLQMTCLNQVVEKTLMLTQTALRKNIQFKTDYDAGLPPAPMDEGQIQQVILNLLLNAGHVMAEGGVIEIRTGRVHRRVDEKERLFVFCQVCDSGPGIPPGIMEYIFDPFFTTKGPGGGTGLGLSTSRGILEQHDGLIEASNRPEKGASFTFFLPVHEIEPREAPSSNGPAYLPAPGDLVLVADDEPLCLDVVVSTLEEAGFSVIRASNGTKALALAGERSSEITWIITDWSMPGPGGPELVAGYRERVPQARMIVTSGFILENEEDGTVDAVLQKPFAPEQLFQTMKQLSLRPRKQSSKKNPAPSVSTDS